MSARNSGVSGFSVPAGDGSWGCSHLRLDWRWKICFQGSVTWYWLLAAAAAKLLQACPTLCDPIDGSPWGSPVQARTLEWVAISFSNTWKWKVKVKSLSRVRLLATPWTAVHQAPPWDFPGKSAGVECHKSSILPQGCLFLAAVGFPSSSNLRDQGRNYNTVHDLISEVMYHHLCHNLLFTHISPCMWEITQRYEYQEARITWDSAGGSSRGFLDSLAPYAPLFPILNSSNSLKIRASGDCPIKSH